MPQKVTVPRDSNNVALLGVYRTITSGVQTVASSGAPVKLISSTTECKRIDVVAQSGNAGICYVGGSNTLASTKTGIPLSPLGSYTFNVTDVSSIYVDSTSSSDVVSFVYFD